jgi:hypothetical protein
MKVNTIKISWGSVMGCIVSFSNLMSTREKRTGEFLCLTFPLLGWICASKESSYPVTFSHTFLHSPTSPQHSTFNPVVSFVSALNLHKECAPTLLKALANSDPNQDVWLQSYKEEKSGLESLNLSTY